MTGQSNGAMKTRLIILLAICFVGFGCTHKKAEDFSKFKKVPILVYTPGNFNTLLNDAFKFTETQDYYLIADWNVYSHDMRYGNLPSRYQNRLVYRNKNPVNIDKFIGIINKSDSCFFLSFTEVDKFNNEILGVIKNGNLTFYDTKGNRFERFGDLALHVFGRENISDVYKELMDNYAKTLIFRNSDLVKTYSIDEAITVLRGNYMFKYYNDPTNIDSAIDNFIAAIGRYVKLPEEKILKLKYRLRSVAAGLPKKTKIPDTIDLLQVVARIDFTPFMTTDVNDILKDILSEQDYDKISLAMSIDRAKAYFAYKPLLYAKKKEIENYYGGDVVIGASSTMENDYLLKKVIFP